MDVYTRLWTHFAHALLTFAPVVFPQHEARYTALVTTGPVVLRTLAND